MPDAHAFIGTLARALYTYDIRIRLSTLGKILHDKGVVPYRHGFDIGSIVAAAYAYWAQRDLQTARAIAYAFTGEQGEMVVAAKEQNVGARESREA